MAKPALIAGVVVLVVTTALAVAWATKPREQADSVPSPPALLRLTFDELGPDGQVCTGPFVIDEHSGQARFKVVGRGRPTPALLFVVFGSGGYRSTGRIPGGYPQPGELRVDLAGPRKAVVVRACVQNRGRRTVGLFAANELRTDSRSITRNARVTVPDLTLAFYERGRLSALRRAPTTVERVSTFRPGIVRPWVVWALAALFVIGVSVGSVAAITMASSRDENTDRR